MNRKKLLNGLLAILALFGLMLAGCSNSQAENGSQDALMQGQTHNKGYLRLSINPEVMIEYDQNGVVTDLYGMNEDGVKIADQYPDFQGKSSDLVLEELVQLIYDNGYFIDKETREARQIVLELEPGSIKPKKDFLQDMSTVVEEKVGQLDFDQAITEDDLISLNEAKKIALEEAGIKAEDAKFEEKDHKFDLKDDTKEEDVNYQFVFTANNKKYTISVNAISGQVKNKKSEDIKQDDKKEKTSRVKLQKLPNQQKNQRPNLHLLKLLNQRHLNLPRFKNQEVKHL